MEIPDADKSQNWCKPVKNWHKRNADKTSLQENLVEQKTFVDVYNICGGDRPRYCLMRHFAAAAIARLGMDCDFSDWETAQIDIELRIAGVNRGS